MRSNKFSKKCFFEALLKLYHEKPYSEIQISEICQTAGYNRSTFYRIYPSKEALLLDGFKEQYVMNYYNSIPAADEENLDTYLHNVDLLFAFIRENHDFFLMMRDAHMVNEMYLHFVNHFPMTATKMSYLYKRNFLAAGYLSAIYEWLDNGMKQSNRYMAELIVTITQSLFPVQTLLNYGLIV